jgi:hypothetical protein
MVEKFHRQINIRGIVDVVIWLTGKKVTVLFIKIIKLFIEIFDNVYCSLSKCRLLIR